MTQYTPGPWNYAGPSDIGRDTYSIYGNGPLAYTAGPSDYGDAAEANARLIAAAPGLLEALKDVAEQIAAYDYLHGKNACVIDDAPALAAIRDLYPCYDPTSNIYPEAKATGQEAN